ncbi:hypothetical protein [Achromobacter deleyi]|uniref:hypothetical protein n=1 Tax=Achromobacter deleyi TaxID=1353891 RepID=UPI001F31D843|nr:hypothetical protein [Achromobacter deleyi]UIP19268.1 hypothetical protein LYZ39_20010 [Achromobacter deleyi]
MLIATAAGASASASAITLGHLRFPAGSTHELLADRMWLHGLPAQVLVFDVPQSPRDLVLALSRQQPALADLHVLPGQLILSGRVGDDHWVAQMNGAGARRTVGSISSVSARGVPANPQPAWLPEGARVRLDVAVMEDGVKVSERIWQHALPPAEMAPLLEAGLRRHGWARGLEEGVVQWWTRERERMMLLLVPLGAGSGLRVNGWAP